MSCSLLGIKALILVCHFDLVETWVGIDTTFVCVLLGMGNVSREELPLDTYFYYIVLEKSENVTFTVKRVRTVVRVYVRWFGFAQGRITLLQVVRL